MSAADAFSLPGLFVYLLPGLEQTALLNSITLTDSQFSIPAATRYTIIPEYVCPSWPHAKTFPNTGPNPWCDGAIVTYVGCNGAGTGGPDGGAGNLPNNGLFRGVDGVSADRVAAINKASLPTARVRDGLSNTLAIAEFVQIDSPGPTFNEYAVAPGNVRCWASSIGTISGGGGLAAWTIKVMQYVPNQVRNRVAVPPAIPSTPFNHLPAGSYHPGGVNALMGDGAVRFVSDMVSLTAWQNAARFADGNLTTLDD